MEHIISHSEQYKCERGCKDIFKTWGALDEHIKARHQTSKKMDGYQCEQCDFRFNAVFQLRQHVDKKHGNKAKQEQPKITCVDCGLILNNIEKMKQHMENCEKAFQAMPPKICRYYITRGCVKGDSCSFAHPEEDSQRKERVPECRNGMRCRYFANGVCSFYHRGYGVQKQNDQSRQYQESSNQGRKTCNYMEDCNRVPNCP